MLFYCLQNGMNDIDHRQKNGPVLIFTHSF